MLRRSVLWSTVVAFCSATLGRSQKAIVVQLDETDVAKARELHERLVAAQGQWERFRTSVRDKYGPRTLEAAPPEHRVAIKAADGREISLPSEWLEGVDFSFDFRFAVPAKRR